MISDDHRGDMVKSCYPLPHHRLPLPRARPLVHQLSFDSASRRSCLGLPSSTQISALLSVPPKKLNRDGMIAPVLARSAYFVAMAIGPRRPRTHGRVWVVDGFNSDQHFSRILRNQKERTSRSANFSYVFSRVSGNNGYHVFNRGGYQ